ncbi:hypothetical protein RQP46_006027 [Phenoliferia psychrophenolica]
MQSASLFEDASGGQKGIAIAGWTVTSTKLSILNAAESDTAAASLHLPLPEICFGNNRLRLEHPQSGLSLDWDALAALTVVERESDVKVAHAAEWARGQAASSSSDVTVQKPFDWTYTTRHPGSLSLSPSPSSPNALASTSTLPPSFTLAPPTHPGIPLHLLARQDVPILFFDEVPLFEDELGDNGIAELVVRVRVNATSVFILSRFFLRVDHVLFRIFDVRLYHAFGSQEIIRETKGREALYDDVKRRLPSDRPDDLTPLTDVNWVSATVEALATTSPPLPPPSTSLGLDRLSLTSGASVPEAKFPTPRWKGEGRILEVLKLDDPNEVASS